MSSAYRHIACERQGEVFCVRFSKRQMGETDILEMADEISRLIQEGCRKLVIRLGPGEMDCLYSVFLAKLVMVQRLLQEQGGRLVLSESSPLTQEIFRACRLDGHFHFAPTLEAAVAEMGP
jgi:anti-anti-sigma regulatory factor